MVFNYKRLNDNTEKDQYSLPGINTIIQRIGKSKIYSKFDLKSGFHQVAMEEKSVPWTSFWAIDGLYEWLVMPFGLKNAPAVFQRKMDACFRGTEEFIAVYIDDILIFSKSNEDHIRHLKTFLEICRKEGLVLSPSKMKIGVPTIDFLGATIGDSRIKLQPHIITKIANFPDEELKTTKGLRSWLGILNYARGYIPNLGRTLGPLYSKTSPTGEKRMNKQDWAIIAQVKKVIQNLPEMEIPEENCHIVIETDGCMEGWGGVCKWKLRKYDPRTAEKVCAYASGKFEPIKSTIDAEVQAVIMSLDKFKIYYLDKKSVTIRTDCHAIVAFYDKTSNNKPSRTRWLTFSDYISGTGIEVTFEHISGKDNILADRLSRLVSIISTSRDEEQIIQLLTAWSEVKNPVSFMVLTEEPFLKCACGLAVIMRKEPYGIFQGKIYYSCPIYRCYAKIWDDELEEYILQRNKYRRERWREREIKREEEEIRRWEDKMMKADGLFTDKELSRFPIVDAIFPEGVTSLTLRFEGLNLSSDEEEPSSSEGGAFRFHELYNSEEESMEY